MVRQTNSLVRREVNMNGSTIVGALLCAVTIGGVTQAAGGGSRPKPRCKTIDAVFTSALTSANCASPVGLCAVGRITHDRFLKGATYITVNDLAPSAGMPASEPATMLALSGERRFSPDHQDGTLLAHATGVFDSAQGYFDELEVITGGTGSLAGASGALHLSGRATGPDTFAGEVRGSICLP
jgi:hypothetical protein